jgi:hypothetical protein
MFYTDYQAILFYDSGNDFFISITRGMVAKLVARLLIILSSQGSNPVIPQNGRHKQRSGEHTLAHQKSYPALFLYLRVRTSMFTLLEKFDVYK